jgi:hypothetical protein
VATATEWCKPQRHSPPTDIDTLEAIRESPEDFCSGGVYPRLFGGDDAGGTQYAGGYQTRPYEDDTRASMHPLAPGDIVIRFFGLLAIGGKTWFLLVFLALEFLSR